MIFIDTFFRGGAIWVLASVGIILWMRRETRAQGWVVFLHTLTFGGFILKTGPLVAIFPPWLLLILKIMAVFVPIILAKMVTDLFLDNRRDRTPVFILGLLSAFAAGLALAEPATEDFRSAMHFAFFGFILYISVSTAKGDLVAKRRLFRPILLGISSALGVFIAITQLFDLPVTQFRFILEACAYLLLNTAFAFFLLNPTQGIWLAPTGPKGKVVPIMRPHNPQLHQKLEAAISEGVWRQEGLTISDLAKQIGGREHHLRALINKDLGFRNFSAFINSYRIEAAKDDLVKHGDKTILEIAYDSGFASLAPFNKAFRDATGFSPKHYRSNESNS